MSAGERACLSFNLGGNSMDMKVKQREIWAGKGDRKTDRTERLGWSEKKEEISNGTRERENDAGSHFYHYQLPHNPPM